MNAAARRKSISPSGLAQREDRRNPGEPTREIDPFHFDSYGNCEAEFLRKILNTIQWPHGRRYFVGDRCPELPRRAVDSARHS